MNRRLRKNLQKLNRKKEDRPVIISGELGIPLNGQKVVEVPNRQGFVFVRLKGNTSELIQAYNASVSPIYDLPVLLTRKNGTYTVIGRNVDRYQNMWGQAPYLPKHGAQHSFNADLNIGGDIVWVYSQQFMPLLAYPSGTTGSPRLAISPYLIRDLNGNWKYVGNTGTPSTTPYNPTTGSRVVMGLVYLDTVSGNPGLLINSGSYMDESATGTSQIAPYIPRISNPNHMPLAAIRLTSGTSSLTWNNVIDVRPFLQVIPTGTGGGGSSFTWNIQDEGIPLGTATTLNVVGPNGDISISGSTARLFITGSTGGGGGTVSLKTDDLSSYINGSRVDFPLSYAPVTNTLRLFYNGLRQAYLTHYSLSGTYVHTLFTPVTGSFMFADYNETASTGTGGSGGAPTTATYLTTASNLELFNEVVIPGLAGSPDIASAAGAGTSEEYDSATTGITWDAAVTTVDSNTTAKSHLYIKHTGDTNTHRGTKAWSPAGAYDARTKVSLGGTAGSPQSFGLFINDNAVADGNGVLLWFSITPATPNRTITAYSYAGGALTQRGVAWTVGSNVIYLRHKRDASNNVSFYFSSDGLAWQLIATVALTFSPTRIGYRLALGNASEVLEVFVDWLRTSV